MNKIISIYLWIFLAIPSVLGQTSVEPNGDGTIDNPYLIANLENLYWFSQNSNVWDKHFLQIADIDASTTTTWDSNNGITPIGTTSIPFTGTYNGQEFKIKNLYINRNTTQFTGMFGFVMNANIEKVGLKNVEITGGDKVGALAGYISGSNIKQSFCSGSISGNDFVGGLVGYCTATSNIENCYSSSNVNGSSIVGGIIGQIDNSSIKYCYSIGRVNGSDKEGGFAGSNNSTIISSFWNNQTSYTVLGIGEGVGEGLSGKTTTELRKIDTYKNEGWDFINESTNGSNDFWGINRRSNNGYPFLSWQDYRTEVHTIPEGDGSHNNPYQISTLDHLQWLTLNESEWDKNYIQTNNINAEETKLWYYGMGFSPIGNDSVNFTGIYNGNGFYIYGLNINFDEMNNVGLFATTKGASISNLGLKEIFVNGKDYVGGLVGCNDSSSTINNCSISGLVIGENYIGGIAGINSDYCTITNCQKSGRISGSKHIGGIAGRNIDHSIIIGCQVEGKANSIDFVGGVTGSNSENSKIINCHGSGKISGQWRIGGIVGSNYKSQISNSSFEGEIYSGNNAYRLGGIAGQNYHFARIDSCKSTVTVTAPRFDSQSIGGSVGSNMDSAVVNYCHSSGNINGGENIGGLVGMHNDGITNPHSSVISNCYSDVNIDGTYKIGGLVGNIYSNNVVLNCYSTGSVSSISQRGGLIGDGYGTVINSFWDKETSGLTYSDGGTGKTTLEMKQLATYTDISTAGLSSAWDFTGNPNNDIGNNDFWSINANNHNGYPYLSNELFAPSITTSIVYGVTSSSAISGGNVFYNGGDSVIAKGVCWNTNGNPTIVDSLTIDGSGNGTFVSNIDGLKENTTYYLRAYATNNSGTSYGYEETFTTIAVSPIVVTESISNIKHNAANAGGNITLEGASQVNSRGVCWNTIGNPTIDDDKTVDGNGIGAFSSTITDLSPSSSYYVRAYAINDDTVFYGSDSSFTTLPQVAVPSRRRNSIKPISNC